MPPTVALQRPPVPPPVTTHAGGGGASVLRPLFDHATPKVISPAVHNAPPHGFVPHGHQMSNNSFSRPFEQNNMPRGGVAMMNHNVRLCKY